MAPENNKAFTILVAEDDSDDRDFVTQAIAESPIKCEVKIVGDGAELLSYLHATPTLPDILLLDINMPKLDGLQALQIIKKDQKLKNIPVYILSTSNAEAHKKMARDLGAKRYCLRTPRYKELVDIIREICTECTT